MAGEARRAGVARTVITTASRDSLRAITPLDHNSPPCPHTAVMEDLSAYTKWPPSHSHENRNKSEESTSLQWKEADTVRVCVFVIARDNWRMLNCDGYIY